MKKHRFIPALLITGLISVCCHGSSAAQSKDANPVTSSTRELYDRFAKNITAAAEEMPAAKYNFRPTPPQQTFGQIIEHVAESNYLVCEMIGDTKPAEKLQASNSDPKDKLVAALKASFDYCSQSLARLQDSQLGDPITFLRGRKTARARAVVELPVDLSDHYSQLSGYLRATGLLPPSAQPQK